MCIFAPATANSLRNNYQYNYKEWNDDLGLYLNDYGFRYFNPQLNQWHSIDPLAEDYYALSSYTYVANNPIKYTDPDGRWISEFEADPNEAMYELMATGPGGRVCDDGCDYNADGAVLHNVSPPSDDEATEYERKANAKVTYYPVVDNVANGDAITNDNTIVGLLWGVEDLAYIGLAKIGAKVSPYIVKSVIWQKSTAKLTHVVNSAIPIVSKVTSKIPTRFISTAKGIVDLQPTLDRIALGIKYAHRNDGLVFRNSEGRLPSQIAGYYKEFVVPTPGIIHAGLQRIVKGANGEMWFTPDHYATFIPITH